MASLGRNSMVSTCGCIGGVSCSSQAPRPRRVLPDSDASAPQAGAAFSFTFTRFFALTFFTLWALLPQAQSPSPSLQHLHLPSHLHSAPQAPALSLQQQPPSAHWLHSGFLEHEQLFSQEQLF